MQNLNTSKLRTIDVAENLIKYDELCMIEFINFGTQNTKNLYKILNAGQEIIAIEKYLSNLITNYMKLLTVDSNNPNIYYVQQILISILNFINHITNLYCSNEQNIEAHLHKQKYILGFIANYVNKFLIQINSDDLKQIFNKSNVFSIGSFNNLKTFVKSHQNDFNSAAICDKFEYFIDILEN